MEYTEASWVSVLVLSVLKLWPLFNPESDIWSAWTARMDGVLQWCYMKLLVQGLNAVYY